MDSKLGVCLFIVGVALAATPARVQSAAQPPMRFGADIESVDVARTHGVPLSYGTVWAGAWNQKQGWRHVESQLRAARQNNVTPVINWWYWGDDISPRCVEEGCRDGRQGVNKSKAEWYRLSEQLSRVIEKSMGTRETLVVLETEFNKGGIEAFEPFDGYLGEHAAIFHRRGNVKVILGLGNWGQPHWKRFDRAIAASDYIGTQMMRSSLRDQTSYMSAVSTLINSASYVQRTFSKPSIVTDLALSSYPAKTYEARQAAVTKELFARLSELKSAGVRAIFYRMIADNPRFDTSNYHGVAERHWGLLRADGSPKPAFDAFVAGIRGEGTTSTVVAAELQ